MLEVHSKYCRAA